MDWPTLRNGVNSNLLQCRASCIESEVGVICSRQRRYHDAILGQPHRTGTVGWCSQDSQLMVWCMVCNLCWVTCPKGLQGGFCTTWWTTAKIPVSAAESCMEFDSPKITTDFSCTGDSPTFYICHWWLSWYFEAFLQHYGCPQVGSSAQFSWATILEFHSVEANSSPPQ